MGLSIIEHSFERKGLGGKKKGLAFARPFRLERLKA